MTPFDILEHAPALCKSRIVIFYSGLILPLSIQYNIFETFKYERGLNLLNLFLLKPRFGIRVESGD